MKRRWVFAMGSLSLFLAITVWQKCTAREDRFIDLSGAGMHPLVQIEGREIYFTFGDPYPDLILQEETTEFRWNAILDHGLTPPSTHLRDWSYLPTYFRWFYGGK